MAYTSNAEICLRTIFSWCDSSLLRNCLGSCHCLFHDFDMLKYAHIIVIFTTLMLCSCRTIEYVPVEKVTTKVDSIFINKVQVDSIYERDSIYFNIYTNGDTVYLNKIKYLYRYIEKLRIDTVHHWHEVNDTTTITKTIEVEKKLSWWENLKIKIGGAAIGAMLATIIIALCIIIFRRKT